MSQWFNLEAALQNNGVNESDVKEIIKKQFEKAPKRKDYEKTQMMQMIRLMLTNTTNADLTFSRIKLSLKLSLKLIEFNWEKAIILRLFLTTRAWRVVLVCPHSISITVIINHTNMAATTQVKLGFLKQKVNFCWIWTLSWRKNECCISLFYKNKLT